MAHITVGTTATRIAYTASSGQTAFTIPFEFFDDDEIKVYNQGTLLTKTDDYGISPVTTYTGGFQGGTVTLGTGATNGHKIVLELDITPQRSTDFPTSGAFNIGTLNTWIDKIMVILKQAFENIDRKIGRASTSTETYSLAWPDGATTTPKIVVASSDAGIELSAVDPSALTTSVNAAASSANAASTSATAAASSATAGASSATAAASSATSAAATSTALAGTGSTTSLAIGTGAKAFTISAGLAFTVGDFILCTSNSGTTNFMHGQIASYSSTTLTLTSANVGGSGTKSDWTIRRSGPLGAQGLTGSTGSQGATGPVGVGLSLALGG